MKQMLQMDIYSVCFLLNFIFCLNVAVFGQLDESLLSLKPSTPSIQHFVNDSFIIFCETVQKNIYPKWKDPGGMARENTKGRVHIETREGLLALVFEHIDLTDKGNWTCEATPLTTGGNSAQEKPQVITAADTRKSFELLVNQKITFGKTELVQSAREGRDATVYCFVKGDPTPDVSWLYYGESINTSNSTKHKKLSDGLFIKNVTQTDAGEYTCRALRITPTFSDSDQITILLRIQHKPHWFSNHTLAVQYAYIDGTKNISCEAMGEPPPSFTWLHDSKAITGRNYRIFPADYGSTLQVHVKNETQFGDYKCKVANPLGTLERVIKLKKGQKPVLPTHFQLRRLFADGLELDIRSAKYSHIAENMYTLGYRVEYMSESDFKFSAGNWSYAKNIYFPFQRRGRFFVPDLERNTTYFMRGACENLAGLSDWSSVKTFSTLANFAARAWNASTWHLCIIMGFSLLLKYYKKIN